jgi:hypothetical protein
MEYYRRLGFAAIAWKNLPRPLQVKFALSHLANRLLKLPIFIMKYDHLTTEAQRTRRGDLSEQNL